MAVTTKVLVIGGGGAGAYDNGSNNLGGGGGGGFQYNPSVSITGGSFSVTVGAGGLAGYNTDY